jgi:hypothetical protein
MRGDMPPLSQYAFMAWLSVKARGGDKIVQIDTLKYHKE